MMSMLDVNVIKSFLVEPVQIELFDSIDSTNDCLLEKKELSRAVCIAEHQTRGKGRLGRQWYSPRGENIYFSYRCHLSKPMGEIGNLSMLIAELVCRVLNQFGIDDGLVVKWPNDVLFDGKKLAGILIEVQAGKDNSSYVVVGVGLNVNQTSDIDSHISQPWTSMQLIKGCHFDRNKIIALLINELDSRLGV